MSLRFTIENPSQYQLFDGFTPLIDIASSHQNDLSAAAIIIKSIRKKISLLDNSIQQHTSATHLEYGFSSTSNARTTRWLSGSASSLHKTNNRICGSTFVVAFFLGKVSRCGTA
jgi:hypothetical protein